MIESWKRLKKWHSGLSKNLKRVHNIAIAWIFIGLIHFLYHFIVFLNVYQMFVGYSFFYGVNYYLSGVFEWAASYGMTISMMQSTSDGWTGDQIIVIILFTVSILLLLGVLLASKRKNQNHLPPGTRLKPEK